MLKKNRSLLIGLIAFVICSGLIVLLIAHPSKSENKPAEAKVEKKAPPVERKEFGLPVDSFDIVKSTIQRNEFLSNILSRYDIGPQTIANLSQKARNVYSVRDIAVGKNYTVFCSKDSSKKAQYFVYQPNAIDYVVYDLRDTLNIYKGQKPVTTKIKTAAGVINSSLYEAMDNAGVNPDLTMKLADIYAWTINFFAIQQGDWFKVKYEENYVDGEPVGLGQIQSAVFSHDGEDFYAFYFKPDSAKEGEYYDEKGKSLRKAFLKAPLKFYRISSHYSMHRFHPVEHRWKAHLGTDFAAPTGTPIMTTGSGVVIASRYTRFNGNYVKIKHNSTYTTQYLHMSKRAVKVGEHVRQGQIIGYVGSTGLATGPHVCYRFWKNGKQVDPFQQHFPAAKPIASSDKPAFEAMMNRQEQTLAAIPLKHQGSDYASN